MKNVNAIENYYKKTKQAIDEGICEYQKGNKKITDLFSELSGNRTNTGKLIAAISLINELLPGSVVGKISNKLNKKDLSLLPIDPEKYKVSEKTGVGTDNKVYLLESSDETMPSYVLKLSFFQSGTRDDIKNTVKTKQECYRKLTDHYSSLPELIPESHFLLVSARKDDQPVIATIQKFIGKDIKDVFSDFKEEELIDVLRSDPNLSDSFIKFSDLTGELYKRDGEIPDLVGINNLSITIEAGRPKLKFIDPDEITSITPENRKQNKRSLAALEYLQKVRQKLHG